VSFIVFLASERERLRNRLDKTISLSFLADHPTLDTFYELINVNRIHDISIFDGLFR
jgi:aryl carrier-like protein